MTAHPVAYRPPISRASHPPNTGPKVSFFFVVRVGWVVIFFVVCFVIWRVGCVRLRLVVVGGFGCLGVFFVVFFLFYLRRPATPPLPFHLEGLKFFPPPFLFS